MGVRHKEFVMEGVQYHPESIASEEGMRMFANFLRWEGGSWDSLKIHEELAIWPRSENGSGARGKKRAADQRTDGIPLSKMSKLNSTGNGVSNGTSGTASTGGSPSILKTIEEKRKQDVATLRSTPGLANSDLLRSLSLGYAPKQIDFSARILSSCQTATAVMAEIKRASPSKGAIDMSAHAPTQALEYALGGAAVISVLTEPTWFKGTLNDMASVRAVLENVENRPAVLRKDFIVDPYQIYEARLAGADTILLIVAILEQHRLEYFISISRALGMEPLVEVATTEEMKRAVKAGSKVIGVNNRDLHTFTVDMNRTSTLATLVPEGTILVALSGITGRNDVIKYELGGAKAVLVGEHLMKATNKREFIRSLRGLSETAIKGSSEMDVDEAPISKKTLVKICGVTKLEDAIVAARAGASFIGLIFAESPRKLTPEQAKAIVEGVKADLGILSEFGAAPLQLAQGPSTTTNGASSWYHANEQLLRSAISSRKGPLFVGVFSNGPFETINRTVSVAGLDLVQFHGDEMPALHAPLIRAPVVKAFHIHLNDSADSVAKRINEGTTHLAVALLDTGVKGLKQQGGSGEKFDWGLAESLVGQRKVSIWMAGGLDASSVADAVKKVKPWCVDVSSGVETAVKGIKDHQKVRAFIQAVEAANKNLGH
jgi:anthranilate synthase/indole-3-glycerol phosphate synthase/phosphoribosylanthranilate isomerase